MRTQIRCPGCGRKHKASHEKRVGTDKAYSPDCVKYERTKGKSWQKGDRAIQYVPHIPTHKNTSVKKVKPKVIKPKKKPPVPKHFESKNPKKGGFFGGLKKMFRGGDK